MKNRSFPFLFVLLGLVLCLGNVGQAAYVIRWLGTDSSNPFTSTNWNPSTDLKTVTNGSLGVDGGAANPFVLSEGTITCLRFEVDGQNTVATMTGGKILNTSTSFHVGQTSKDTNPTGLADAPVFNMSGGILTNRIAGASKDSGVYIGFTTSGILNIGGTAEIDIASPGRFFISAQGGDSQINSVRRNGSIGSYDCRG